MQENQQEIQKAAAEEQQELAEPEETVEIEHQAPKIRGKLPPYVILAIIAVASALVLGLTNLVTADPIATRKQREMEAAFSAVMPQGEHSYKQLTDTMVEVQDDGVTAGYAVKASAVGYGGDVAVVLGFDAQGTVIGAQVGDGSFQETSGIGAQWLGEDNVGKLLGISALEGGSIDAISGATVTSRAVLAAANEGVRAVAEQIGAEWEEDPVTFGASAGAAFVVVSSSATSTAVIDSSYAQVEEQGAWSAHASLEGAAPGYDGQQVGVYIILDENGEIAQLTVDASTQTESIGGRCEEPAFTDQFIGKAAPLSLNEDIDALSGATLTSGAVVEAVNTAAAVSPWRADASLAGEAQGFGGTVTVHLTLDAEGRISRMTVDVPDETAGLGSKCGESDFTNQFVGKAAPLTLNEDVDAVSGATVTSTAVVKAVNEAYAVVSSAVRLASGQWTAVTLDEDVCYVSFDADYSGAVVVTYQVQDGQVSAVTVDNEEEPPLVTVDDQGRYVTSYPGFGDQPVTIYVTLDENGAVATFEVDASTQTDGIGTQCADESFTGQFIGKTGRVRLGSDVTAVSGATETSTAVVRAWRQMLENMPTAEMEAETGETEEENTSLVTIDDQGRYVTSYPGFGDQPVTIYVTLDENGAVATFEVDASTQTDGIGTQCADESFTGQFIGKTGRVRLGSDVTAVSGATETSTAVVRAWRQMLENMPTAE